MKTQRAIDVIQRGGFIMGGYDPDDGSLKYRCMPIGGGLSPKQAQSIISRLKLKPQPDALFEDVPPQTWRLP